MQSSGLVGTLMSKEMPPGPTLGWGGTCVKGTLGVTTAAPGLALRSLCS